jgi:hypothetical protein
MISAGALGLQREVGRREDLDVLTPSNNTTSTMAVTGV